MLRSDESKKMTWEKIGLIYTNKGITKNLVTHSSNPLALSIDENIVRIYFSSRNIHKKSSVGSVDFDFLSLKVIKGSEKEVFTFIGGSKFFSDGISLGATYSTDDRHYVLFMGWSLDSENPWTGRIGRFEISNDYKWSLNPKNAIIDIDQTIDKLSLSYPFVLKEKKLFRMWYGSTVYFGLENDEMIHPMNYAISNDGINWKKCGLAFPIKKGKAQIFSRPQVVNDKNGYHMWFSFWSIGSSYRIGYAHSDNGCSWDIEYGKAEIDTSSTGWDSEMTCYPCVYDHKGTRYMFYCGNGYGKSGIGLAVMK